MSAKWEPVLIWLLGLVVIILVVLMYAGSAGAKETQITLTNATMNTFDSGARWVLQTNCEEIYPPIALDPKGAIHREMHFWIDSVYKSLNECLERARNIRVIRDQNCFTLCVPGYE